MKLLHCADIHLGAKIEGKLPKDKSDIRKSEVLSTFGRMIDYAKEHEIKIILLSGDVFDKDIPSSKDKEFFYKCIKANSEIDFLYLNGNHDKEGSYVEVDIPNLKTFSKDDFVSYDYGNISISGIEMTEENAKSFYSKLDLNKDKINIVMLHGDVSDSLGMDKIKIDNLKGKYIDYLALGHIHSHKYGKIDDRGIFAFPGCLEGRGFDEVGEKGFIILDINTKVEMEFVPFAFRTIHEIDVDVTSASDLFDITQIVKEKTSKIDNKDIIRINLIGELGVGIEVNENDVSASIPNFFFVNVKNKTTLKIDYDSYKDDKSLIGEFVRGVYLNPKYSAEEKSKIITMGIMAIQGKEVE